MSYLVDYFQVQGVLRWSLIIIFMLLKAGLIVSIFMHLAWERLSLIYAILVPPLCLAALVGIRLVESHRSEEHTSELLSLMRHSYAAICLKKKRVTYMIFCSSCGATSR